jgi:tetratricopeptide (TPR) repeat protein
MEPRLSAIAALETEALFDAALDCMAQGDPASAVGYFEHIVALDPKHTEANHGLIRALEDAGRVDDAMHATQRLIASQPDDVLAMTRLSMIYQHKGMIPEAEAAAAKAKILGWKQELRGGIATKNDL